MTESGVTVKVAVAAKDAVADGFNERVAPGTELEGDAMTTVKVMMRLSKPLRSFRAIVTMEPDVAVGGMLKTRVVSPTRVTEPK